MLTRAFRLVPVTLRLSFCLFMRILFEKSLLQLVKQQISKVGMFQHSENCNWFVTRFPCQTYRNVQHFDMHVV